MIWGGCLAALMPGGVSASDTPASPQAIIVQAERFYDHLCVRDQRWVVHHVTAVYDPTHCGHLQKPIQAPSRVSLLRLSNPHGYDVACHVAMLNLSEQQCIYDYVLRRRPPG